MEKSTEYKDSQLRIQLAFLEKHMKSFKDLFWRLGFKLLHDDPDCNLETYFQKYFPSQDELLDRLEEERRKLKEKQKSREIDYEETLKQFNDNLIRVERMEEILFNKIPEAGTRKKKTIYSDCNSVRDEMVFDKKMNLNLNGYPEEPSKSGPELSKLEQSIVKDIECTPQIPLNLNPEKSNLKSSESRSTVADHSVNVICSSSKCHCSANSDLYPVIGFVRGGERVFEVIVKMPEKSAKCNEEHQDSELYSKKINESQ